MPHFASRRDRRVRLTKSRLVRFVLFLFLLAAALPARAQTITEYPTSAQGAIDGAVPTCVADAHTLCLNNDRFSVTAAFQLTPTGPSFQATAVRLTADSGYFWFFDPDNVELVVKVLNACVDPFDSYWFFAAGLTNVGVGITVQDTVAGQSKTYTSPLGTAFQPIQDTGAFATCP